jgi:hypothetical protein
MDRVALALSRLVGLLAVLGALAPTPALAAEDGAYGRLEGDLGVELRAGTAIAKGGPALAAELGAVYLATAGAYVHYTDALGRDATDVARSIATGVQLRPLFWGRYARGMETGPARWDLLLDSVTLAVGAFWDAPHGAGLVERPGLELGLGVVFPFLEDASGPYLGLRGALRWRALDLEGLGDGGIVDQGALVSLTVGWHQVVGAGIVDLRDRRGLVGRARAPAGVHRW